VGSATELDDGSIVIGVEVLDGDATAGVDDGTDVCPND
jgi:hypothetical protein